MRGLDQDIINLRFKHFQHRLIDTLNRVIEKRRKNKEEEKRIEAKGEVNMNASQVQLAEIAASPSAPTTFLTGAPDAY